MVFARPGKIVLKYGNDPYIKNIYLKAGLYLSDMIIKTLSCLLLVSLFATAGFSQAIISGSLVDKSSGVPLSGVNISVKGRLVATITDADGHFLLHSPDPAPMILIFTHPGYMTSAIRLDSMTSGLMVRMQALLSRGQDELSLRSPLALEIPLAAGGYEAVSMLQGVQLTRSSLPLITYNIRGFGASANMRLLQLSDGIDEAPPLLNFPLGTPGSISGLDIQHLELQSGPASARYGPNAFNGILLINSKDPFTHQGLSLEVNSGFSQSAAGGTHPYHQLSGRYAKAIRGFALKLNGSYLRATDWLAGDYLSGRTDTDGNPDAPAFDGRHTYGDEWEIAVPMASLAEMLSQTLAPLYSGQLGLSVAEAQTLLAQTIPRMPSLRIRRTGIRESDLLDSREAGRLQLDGALHYRINGQLEASYSHRFSSTSAIIQDSERIALRNFKQRFHRLELSHTDFWLRGYWSLTDAGNSYNLSTLGAVVNERLSPTETGWLPAYAGRYATSLLPVYLTGALASNQQLSAAHSSARNAANLGLPLPGAAEFRHIVDSLRQEQRLIDDSGMIHADAGYRFDNIIHPTVVSIQAGANFRQYRLFSGGTILNEDPDSRGRFDRINIREFGAYVEMSKAVFAERLHLSTWWRYDKQEHFKGQFSPRLAAVLNTGSSRRHYLRASYQTGFRNPGSREQFMFVPGPQGIHLGSTAANAERYGLFHGGAYTARSYDAFIATVLAGNPDTGRLVRQDMAYLQPEQQRTAELGYRGLLRANLLFDISAHHTLYRQMITQETVYAARGTVHRGEGLPGVSDILAGNAPRATAWRPFFNAGQALSTAGLGLSIAYQPLKQFTLYGNYAYITLSRPAGAFAGFNMPEHSFVVGLSGQQMINKIGFDAHYRWQDAFRWEDNFASAAMPTLGVLNARISYALSRWKTTITASGTNLLGEDYRTHAGGPFVGRVFYLGLRYDGL